MADKEGNLDAVLKEAVDLVTADCPAPGMVLGVVLCSVRACTWLRLGVLGSLVGSWMSSGSSSTSGFFLGSFF